MAKKRIGELVDCNWCGSPCRRRGGHDNVYCDSKCYGDAHASRIALITTIESVVRLIEQGLACAACNRRVQVDLMDGDHVQPKSKGGPDIPENAQLLCRSCSVSKGATPWLEWLAKGLRWTAGPSMDGETATAALIYFCKHKKLEARCRALLDDRVSPQGEDEVVLAPVLLDWLGSR